METKIKAIHFDVSEKLVAFINKKVEKLTRRFDAVTEVEVTQHSNTNKRKMEIITDKKSPRKPDCQV